MVVTKAMTVGKDIKRLWEKKRGPESKGNMESKAYKGDKIGCH